MEETDHFAPNSGTADSSSVPRLADGVRLLGAYDSQGLRSPRYLVQRSDGQVILLSELLYLTARGVNGERDLDEVALEVTCHGDRALTGTDVSYLINTKLTPLGLVFSGPSAPRVAIPRADPLLSLALRGVLVPTCVVRALAKLLRPMFFAPIIVTVLLGLGAVDVWLFAERGVSSAFDQVFSHPALMLAALGLLAATTLFHEFGHATACRYGGGQPGAIGVGVYIMFPAFYTNVTDSYRLDRRSRLRTDLGGVYFNAVFILCAGAIYRYTGYTPLVVVIVLTHVEILQQLVPVVRFDGYYVLADLVGVPDLFARIRPIMKSLFRRQRVDALVTELTRWTRVVVTAWVMVIVPLLVTSLALLLVHVPRFAAHTWVAIQADWRQAANAFHSGNVGIAALATLSIVFLLVPVLGLTTLLVRSLRTAGRFLGRRRPRHRGQHDRQQAPRHTRRRQAGTT